MSREYIELSIKMNESLRETFPSIVFQLPFQIIGVAASFTLGRAICDGVQVAGWFLTIGRYLLFAHFTFNFKDLRIFMRIHRKFKY